MEAFTQVNNIHLNAELEYIQSLITLLILKHSWVLKTVQQPHGNIHMLFYNVNFNPVVKYNINILYILLLNF